MYEDANHIPARQLVGRKSTIVFSPEGAYYNTGDGWELVKVSFKDGNDEIRNFSAFKGSVSDDVWDELVSLVREFDRMSSRVRWVLATGVVATVDDEYLNINPTKGSDVLVGPVGDILREKGLRD